MAWNPHPKIQDLRELSAKWGAQQLIVLEIDQSTGTFQTHSYGQTKRLCDLAKPIGDQIHKLVSSGEIEIDL